MQLHPPPKMAMPFLNHTENPLNLQKLQKNPKKSNQNSFWAFLLSIFIYTSVFYVFNLSPSTLVFTSKFWFFISNTLILIIAADFGACSSKDRDVLDEYVPKNVNASAKSSTVIPSYEIVKIDERLALPEYRSDGVPEEPQEKIITMVAAATVDDDDKTQIQKKPEEIFFPAQEKMKEKKGDRKAWRKKRARTFSAAEAEKEVGGGKVVLQRTLSERRGEEVAAENEFSRMSDEELNRRVEEFIRRCNKQIRLEAAVRNR